MAPEYYFIVLIINTAPLSKDRKAEKRRKHNARKGQASFLYLTI
jgi:hypothetical protein